MPESSSATIEAVNPDTPSSEGEALFVLSLDGFEGPIDLLLHLAKDQKLDLTKISILKLAEQYLIFIEEMHSLRLEVAADYLVMAAWLAYLKSRLLLPKQERTSDEEPSGEELAAALALQMQRLEAIQKAAAQLLLLPRMGYDVFARGSDDDALEVVVNHQPTATIYDLLSAYAHVKKRTDKPAPLRFVPFELYSIDEAIERLRHIVKNLPEWTTISSFLPRGLQPGVVGRSAIAANLIASLELAKQGLLEVRQDRTFAPIWVRQVRTADGDDQHRVIEEEKESYDA